MKKMPDSVRLPKPCLCPACGSRLDASTSMFDEDASPDPGDFSMCLDCGAVLVYARDMTMALAEPADLAKLPSATLRQLLAMQLARRAVAKSAPPKEPESEH